MGKRFCIVLLRHAERLDRAMESQGLDWIHNAQYPQDSPLSDFGRQQAEKIGSLILQHLNLTHVYVSPLIRTVTTGDIISRQLTPNLPLRIETGLIEEAKSFRGRLENEPKPVWIDNKLHHSPEYLKENYSDLIDTSFQSLHQVTHSPDSTTKNRIRENHDTLVNLDEITRDRCYQFISKLKSYHQSSSLSNGEEEGEGEGYRILCIGHGASCSGCASALEEGLPDSLKIHGGTSIASWATFIPLDESNLSGPWYCPEGGWQSLPQEILTSVPVENVADRGFG